MKIEKSGSWWNHAFQVKINFPGRSTFLVCSAAINSSMSPSLPFPFQYLTNIRTRYISWLQSINLNINHVNIQWLHTSQWHTSKISFVSWFRKLPFYLVIGGHQSPHLFNIRLSSIIFKLQFWFIITGSYLS